MLFIFFYQQAFLSFLQKKYNSTAISTATSTAISITTSTPIFEIWDEKIMNAKYEEFVKQIFEIEFEFDFDFDFEMINHLPLPYSSFA